MSKEQPSVQTKVENHYSNKGARVYEMVGDTQVKCLECGTTSNVVAFQCGHPHYYTCSNWLDKYSYEGVNRYMTPERRAAWEYQFNPL